MKISPYQTIEDLVNNCIDEIEQKYLNIPVRVKYDCSVLERILEYDTVLSKVRYCKKHMQLVVEDKDESNPWIIIDFGLHGWNELEITPLNKENKIHPKIKLISNEIVNNNMDAFKRLSNK